MNKKIIINVGISGSGKSTWTKNYLADHENYLCVNRDAYRYMFRNVGMTEYYIELLISEQVDEAIRGALKANYNIIIDATNLSMKHINHFVKLFGTKADIYFNTFDTTLEECIVRDKNRERSVGEEVILRQYEQLKVLKETFDFKPIYRKKWKDKIYYFLMNTIFLR